MTKAQARRQAKQLFRLCLVNGRLEKSRTEQVVQHIGKAGYRACPAILAHFLRLAKLDRARHTANIESATPLSPDLLAAIENSVKRRFGPALYSNVALRPSLLGGVRIQVGSDLYDGSVQAGLAALERSF
jgi:F-type H+-transporting ATPase subunit delta